MDLANEWQSIIQLLAMVFGFGVVFQKMRSAADASNAKNSEQDSRLSKIENRITEREDKMHEKVDRVVGETHSRINEIKDYIMQQKQ